jgi:hypothetical protein
MSLAPKIFPEKPLTLPPLLVGIPFLLRVA